MPLLPGVFLRDLQLDGLIRMRHGSEQRRRWLAHLKINGAVLDLNHYVIFELSIQRMEVVVSGAGAICLDVTPIQMMVVNECPIHQHAVMRRERAGDDVGGVGGSASVLRRAGAAFGVGFDHETAEIGDAVVNRIGRLLPPRSNVGIERVERLQSADHHGTAHVHGDRQLHAPWAKSVGNACQLRNEFGAENQRAGVDVVDGASVDADRGQ